jgi:transcriptional regulator NrdR family protein
VERIDIQFLTVRKRDGEVEPFQREKIVTGIGRAASVFSIPAADVNAFIDRILDELQPAAPGIPIPTVDIGNLVLRFLQDATSVTDVARIRFAMVFLGRITRHGGFRDASDFKRWLKALYPLLEDDEPIPGPLIVLKRHSREAQAFDIGKLERSIGIASKGRGTNAEIRRLATELAKQVVADLSVQPIVTSQQIAHVVLQTLRKTDDIAYLRYAATTKPFRSVEDFWLEATALAREKGAQASVS